MEKVTQASEVAIANFAEDWATQQQVYPVKGVTMHTLVGKTARLQVNCQKNVCLLYLVRSYGISFFKEEIT